MLYLPIGAPGSGKSTLCEWAVKNGVITKETVICPDEIRKWMTGDRARQDRNSDVFKVVNTVLDCRLQLGLDAWVDATNFGFKTARYTEHNEVTTILCDIPEVELWERNKTREHPVPEAVLETMIGRLRAWKVGRTDYITAEEFMEKYA